MELVPTTLGQALRTAREDRGWKRWELAQKLGIDPKNVERWELGHNAPSLPMYERLCVMFDWPLPYTPQTLPLASGGSTGTGYFEETRVDLHLPFRFNLLQSANEVKSAVRKVDSVAA